MKIGDLVGYFSVIGDEDFQHVGKIYDIWENGIPSNPERMVKIEGKAGVVCASHCRIISQERANAWIGDQQRRIAG